MKKTNSFLVVSRYKENVDWIHNYTDNYIVYNKGDDLLYDFKQIKRPNFGGNQYDICHFIYKNYENLPDLIAFCQGYPFDHCPIKDFDRLIQNQYYTNLFSVHANVNYPSGFINEPNNNWYLYCPAVCTTPTCKVSSTDEFANSIFENYTPNEFTSFPPGSQFIVEKERCLHYSKRFWNNIMKFINSDVGSNGGKEAHVLERMMQLIFETRFKEKSIYLYE